MNAQKAERLARLAEAARTLKESEKDAREARDRAIAEADHDGESLGDIARVTGLGRSHVHRLVLDQAAKQG